MYEPVRSPSVHTLTGTPAGIPHRSRKEELDIQLAGHLAVLLAAVEEIRALTPDTGLDTLAQRLADHVARLRGGDSGTQPAPAPAPASTSAPAGADTGTDGAHDPRARIARLHRRAHDLAGRALVVAASRADTAAAILAAQCMDAHAAAGAHAATTEGAGPAGPVTSAEPAEPAEHRIAAPL